jgi:hypothetical protein
MDRPVALGVMIVALAALSLPASAQTPGALGTPAPAAPAGPTTLPSIDLTKEIRTSATPQSDSAAIDAFIKTNIQNLMMDKNPGAQSEGRRYLERPVNGVGGPTGPSPQFINYYVAQLDKALAPPIASKNVRTRLNAAIVVYYVTAHAQDTQLQDLVLTLMRDKTDAVALYGVKAAGAVIPVAVAGNTAGAPPILQLIQAISKTVAAHNSSAIVQEAYLALSLGVPDLKISLTGAAPVIDEIERVLDGRIKKYTAGIPEDPGSDRLAVTFLTNEKIQAVLTPAQKAKALQLLSDLAQVGAGQFTYATVRPDKDQLAYITSFAAKGLLVASAPQKGSPLEDALLKVAKVNTNSPAAQVLADVKAMAALLQKQYADIKPAPAVAPPPTTAPTVAPVAPAPAH